MGRALGRAAWRRPQISRIPTKDMGGDSRCSPLPVCLHRHARRHDRLHRRNAFGRINMGCIRRRRCPHPRPCMGVVLGAERGDVLPQRATVGAWAGAINRLVGLGLKKHIRATAINTGDRMSPFLPLAQETRSHVPTAQAAYYLTRRNQTLRKWSMRQTGPIKPTRLHGRLLWPVSEIRRLLEGTA